MLQHNIFDTKILATFQALSPTRRLESTWPPSRSKRASQSAQTRLRGGSSESSCVVGGQDVSPPQRSSTNTMFAYVIHAKPWRCHCCRMRRVGWKRAVRIRAMASKKRKVDSSGANVDITYVCAVCGCCTNAAPAWVYSLYPLTCAPLLSLGLHLLQSDGEHRHRMFMHVPCATNSSG